MRGALRTLGWGRLPPSPSHREEHREPKFWETKPQPTSQTRKSPQTHPTAFTQASDSLHTQFEFVVEASIDVFLFPFSRVKKIKRRHYAFEVVVEV